MAKTVAAPRVILPKAAVHYSAVVGGGFVIQPAWVYIGNAGKKCNMTDNNDGTYTYSSDGKKYRATGELRHGYVVVKLENGNDSEDEMSDYSQQSLANSEDEFEGLGGRSTNVLGTYRTHKHDDFGMINTSEGLSKIVNTMDTGNQSAANTHVLYRHEDDDLYEMLQLGTALGVKLYAKRFSFGVSKHKNVQAVWGKSAGVHTEMHLLHLFTNGKAKDIAGCLEGYRLVVDKPVCADCYPYVVSANPDEVRDSTDFFHQGANTRETWPTWKNPFG